MTQTPANRDYYTINGRFISHKFIKTTEPIMILIKFSVADEVKTAIIVKNALRFIEEVYPDDAISLYGYTNQRKQFVISKYLITSTQHTDLPAHLKYPKQRHPDDSL
ncbi:hypothetical protein [Fundicoccus culcitae]|uniref:Uncharacterized protein n=1 Tax=Fundicoccus culcitae TaxID=2969821 RepID=A0ABY5P559_9LACT|nr:hypothetical protein [Fundicoccus culcitae]UUX33829.1 hypothetical protein NRE15_13220 [Fundicoccus culcitae]